ncbi:SRPBCC family protein [Sinosporangium album]|uniref:SRPBCC family protein n=1 Tax=Sinosporangium album TaxID=504805 RepID=UPI001FDEA98A|nr:SRPBCC family protein [Sinosporangium album]
MERALGWAGLTLGAAQLVAPRAMARLRGANGARAISAAMGARELMHAATLLNGATPTRWAWSRVAGDAVDLVLLSRAMTGRTRKRRRTRMLDRTPMLGRLRREIPTRNGDLTTAAATAVVAGITAVDLVTALRATRHRSLMSLHASVTINRPREEVYRYWRDVENLPNFMIHVESVRAIDEYHSRWKAKAPFTEIEWTAEVIDERPNELIAWHSVRGSRVITKGSVIFTDEPAGRGTVVTVAMKYAVPGGTLGTAIARMLGEHPEQQVRDDLRRLKQVLETGEVLRSDGSPEGVRALRQARQRPAQPVGGRS